MYPLLGALLFDARERCRHLVAEAEQVAARLPPLAGEHLSSMRHRLDRFRELLDALIASPDVQHPELARHIYFAYKRITEFLQAFEERTLLVAGRFTEADLVATRLVLRICEEIGFPYRAPLCSTVSAQYYWADPGMDIVFVTPCAHAHLLGLPDIYHELGHFLLHRERRRILVALERIVDDYFNTAVQDANRRNWPRGSIEALEGSRKDWKRSWLLEFACDMFAAFCAGPAYGWCNVRLCTNLSENVVAGSHSHPADAARARDRCHHSPDRAYESGRRFGCRVAAAYDTGRKIRAARFRPRVPSGVDPLGRRLPDQFRARIRH